MNNALISPNENNRIAQVEVQPFDVASPLYWVECAEDVTTEWTYDGTNFIAPVIPEPVAIVPPTVAELLDQLDTIRAQLLAITTV